MRKPDCLHLPCNPPFLGSPPYNLHEDVFHKVPLVRRAEPCTHNPQQQCRSSAATSKQNTSAAAAAVQALTAHSQNTGNRAAPRYSSQSSFQTSKVTHVGHPPRGSQWEQQPTHHSAPPSNVQEYGSDTDLLESSPPGPVLWGSQCKGELIQPAPQPQL